jgi:hypothetical protein
VLESQRSGVGPVSRIDTSRKVKALDLVLSLMFQMLVLPMPTEGARQFQQKGAGRLAPIDSPGGVSIANRRLLAPTVQAM